MSDLHQEQLSHIADIVGTYSADPDDPTSLEVLLVLQEICHILEIPHYEMVSIFGKRTLHALRTWGKPTGGNAGHASARAASGSGGRPPRGRSSAASSTTAPLPA